MQAQTTPKCGGNFGGILNSQVSNISKFLIESILNASSKTSPLNNLSNEDNISEDEKIAGDNTLTKTNIINSGQNFSSENDEIDSSEHKTERLTSTPKQEVINEDFKPTQVSKTIENAKPRMDGTSLSPVKKTDETQKPQIAKPTDEIQNLSKNFLYSTYANSGLGSANIPGISVAQTFPNLYPTNSSTTSFAQISNPGQSPSGLIASQQSSTNQIAESLSLFNYLQQAAVFSCNPALLLQAGGIAGLGGQNGGVVGNQQMENYSRLLALGMGGTADQTPGRIIILKKPFFCQIIRKNFVLANFDK